MKRIGFALGLSAMASMASAQIPDVKVKLDATLSYVQGRDRGSTARYYSVFGRQSVVALTFNLEPGFTAFLSQKLERIPNDPDTNFLDEAYVEDEGIWRLGKQYLPFGSGNILRESVYAARAETSLIVEQLPIRAAVCDMGMGRQQGVVGRIGGNPGFSFATGKHFGINGTSLTQLRRPEDSPGLGRGWRTAFGFDGGFRSARFDFRGEVVALRNGHTDADLNQTIFDFTARVGASREVDLTFGYTKEAESTREFFRAMVDVEATENLRIRPFVRVRGRSLWDVGVEARFRL